jgi:hypothetical protein
MNSCEIRKCQFWNGKNCTDELEFINTENGGSCCRYHPNAILKDDTKEEPYLTDEDLDIGTGG